MKLAIIGFGASGLFCALELKDSNFEVDIYDIGPDFTKRVPCPIDMGKIEKCPPCKYCSVYSSGGIYNDGKTIKNASPLIGGNLWDLIGEKRLQENIDNVVKIFQNAGANNPITVPDKDDLQWIESRAVAAGMIYGYQELLHMGSDKLPSIIKNIYSEISDKFNFIWRTKVENIYKQDSKYLVEDNKGNKKEYDILVISAGRSGSSWVMNTNIYPSFKTEKGRVDIGVRLETSNEIMHEINKRFYEAKLYYKAPTFGDIVRSFCSNPSGFVCIENNKDYSVVNGHAKNDVKSKNTNFAILVSKTFTEPFKSPVKYGNAVASLANMLGGGPLVQRYGDLKRGRRTKDLTFNSIQPTLSVTSGDLSLAFPYRILKSIMEYIEAADKISPGLASDDTLLYGIEAKYFTEKIKVTEHMEALDNCYVIGDVSGHTRGISQSCVSGVLAGNHLRNKFKGIF